MYLRKFYKKSLNGDIVNPSFRVIYMSVVFYQHILNTRYINIPRLLSKDLSINMFIYTNKFVICENNDSTNNG